MNWEQELFTFLGSDEAQAIRQEFVDDERKRYMRRLDQAAKDFAESHGVQYGDLFKDASGVFYNDEARKVWEQLHGGQD